ncbi:hypothetical protein D3C84_1165000 [compost metagenome]
MKYSTSFNVSMRHNTSIFSRLPSSRVMTSVRFIRGVSSTPVKPRMSRVSLPPSFRLLRF